MFTGYHVTGGNLLRQALDATVNKRLALLGDAILKPALLDEWWSTGSSTSTELRMHRETMLLTDAHPEQGNDILKDVACNANLQRVARQAGVGAYITVNPSQRGEAPSDGVLSHTMEAILGVIWLDSDHDFQAVKAAIESMGLVAYEAY